MWRPSSTKTAWPWPARSALPLSRWTLPNGLGTKVPGYFQDIDSLVARVMYTSLYKMHELALHGVTKVALETLTRAITRRTESHVKLH